MDENTKLYVFSRREVALIFLFLILVALTSFVLGVRVGKGFSYEASGLNSMDRQRVDLLSGQEEKVNEVVDEVHKSDSTKKVNQGEIKERLEELIAEETNDKKKAMRRKVAPVKKAPVKPVKEVKKDVSAPVEAKPMLDMEAEKREEKEAPLSVGDNNQVYSGKFTIQLASYQSIEDAKAFAEGFRIRGYNPIINEAEISSGVWFRVSLGVFDSVTEAKNYVNKESSLFQGQDYRIRKFD